MCGQHNRTQAGEQSGTWAVQRNSEVLHLWLRLMLHGTTIKIFSDTITIIVYELTFWVFNNSNRHTVFVTAEMNSGGPRIQKFSTEGPKIGSRFRSMGRSGDKAQKAEKSLKSMKYDKKIIVIITFKVTMWCQTGQQRDNYALIVINIIQRDYIAHCKLK